MAELSERYRNMHANPAHFVPAGVGSLEHTSRLFCISPVLGGGRAEDACTWAPGPATWAIQLRLEGPERADAPEQRRYRLVAHASGSAVAAMAGAMLAEEQWGRMLVRYRVPTR